MSTEWALAFVGVLFVVWVAVMLHAWKNIGKGREK